VTPDTSRRWFRYSLRTLFVVVTAFACWLGYEWNWIRQRREFLAKFQAQIERPIKPLRYSRAALLKRNLEFHQVSSRPPLKPFGPRAVLWLFREPVIPQLTFTFEEADDWIVEGGQILPDVLQPAEYLFPETQFHANMLNQIRWTRHDLTPAQTP
jgi:hypothetical protein